jgi:hypothetical protein
MMYGAQVAALAAGIGIAVAAAPAAADFDGHLIFGQFYYPDDDTPTGSFEAIVDPDSPEYIYSVPGHPFDGFYYNLAGSTLTFKVSVTDFVSIYFGEADFTGVVFSDVNGTMDDFVSLAIEDSYGQEVDFNLMEYGVLNEDQFFINFGPISGIDNQMYNADFVTFDMTFVPAPAGGLLLLGAFTRRRRRN